MRVASCTTWLLVRIRPSGVNTKPEPPPCRSRGSPERLLRRLRDIDLDYRRAELLRSAHDRLRVGIEQGGIVQSAASAGGLDSWLGIICNREGNCFLIHVC